MTRGLLLLNFDHELDYTNLQTSSISRTKFQNLHVSHLVFAQFIEAKCWVENEDVVGAASKGDVQLHLSDQQFYSLLKCDLY